MENQSKQDPKVNLKCWGHGFTISSLLFFSHSGWKRFLTWDPRELIFPFHRTKQK